MPINKLKILLLLFLLIGGVTGVTAQNEPPPPSDAPGVQPPKRPGLLAQLDLSPDQVRQIREINQQNRPKMREASQRLKEANHRLDAAVYSDLPDEADIQSKIKEVHAAHSEVVKFRTRNEFAVRKVLSLEQLVKFREIRRQSIAEKENSPRPRDGNPNTDQRRPPNNPSGRNRPPN